MKLLLASDIHGSSYWCEKLMDAIRFEQPDNIILLGDLLYHGPRNPLSQKYDAMKVAEMLNSIANKIIAVRGNCDAEVDQMVLDFSCGDDFNNVCMDGTTIWFTHGHLYDPSHLPELSPGSIFAFGHIHEQVNYVNEQGIQIVNPGSVSLPKDGKHGYALITSDGVQLKQLGRE